VTAAGAASGHSGHAIAETFPNITRCPIDASMISERRGGQSIEPRDPAAVTWL
jgi:hypothetical protein